MVFYLLSMAIFSADLYRNLPGFGSFHLGQDYLQHSVGVIGLDMIAFYASGKG
jgi:hypothetical protein